MNDFQSPPLNIYKQAHTHLNNYIKISIAAVENLAQLSEDNGLLSVELSRLIQGSGERWTPRDISDPRAELSIVKNDLAKSGIIWVYSAFDVYYKKMEGFLSEHFEVSKKKSFDNKDGCSCGDHDKKGHKIEEKDNNEQEADEKKLAKIIELYRKMHWPLESIKLLLPILKFYELLRHCIAHNMGRPNAKLIYQYNSYEFQESIEKWETKFVAKNISPPPIIEGQEIKLKGHHAILYSETCLRIAKDIDQRYFQVKDLSYFIKRIIKTHLMDV